MLGEPASMRTWYKNPIAYTFGGIAFILLSFSVFNGVKAADSFQLVFAPYTYDMSGGVGDTLANYIAAALLAIQIGLVTMAASVHKLSNILLRRTLWGFGVVLVIVYFVVTILGFLITGFH